MRKRRMQELWLCTGSVVLAGLAVSAHAQSVSGNLATTGVNYGTPAPGSAALATQTINTGFGDSTVGDGTSSGGSGLDAAYATVENGNLYVFLAGNIEGNTSANHANLFIDSTSGGMTTLNLPTSGMPGNNGALSAMNTSQFSPGFAANYALDANDYQGTLYIDQYDLISNIGNYLGSVPLSGGIGANQNLSGIQVGFNNTNAAGVNGDTGTAASQSAAQAVGTGLEFGVSLAALGNPAPGSSILLLADVNGGSDGYLSNQFLPGLAVGTGNVGGGGPYSGSSSAAFNFSTTPGEYFSVQVPNTLPNGDWLTAAGGSWQKATNWSNSAIPNASGALASFSAAAAGGATVTLDGAISVGTLVISGSNSYTLASGTGGTLTMNNGSSSASISTLSGSHTISAPIVLDSNTTIEMAEHGEILTISGNISGSGALSVVNQDGLGAAYSATVLSGSNTFTGGVTVVNGNLQLGGGDALPSGTALTLSAVDLPAGVLDMNGNSINISSLTEVTGPNTTSLGAVGQVINTTATAGTATLTYAGTAANPSTFIGNITDSSATSGGATELNILSGSLTLTGTNTYGGGTMVDSGASLTIASAAGNGVAFPTGSNITNNGTFAIGNADVVSVGSIKGTGTTVVGANSILTAINLNGGPVIDDGSLEVIGSGVAGPISDSGAGTLTVDSSFQLAAGSGASEITNLALGSGAVLDMNGNNLTVANFNYSGGSTITNNSTNSGSTLFFNGTGSSEFDGNLTNGNPPVLADVRPGLRIAGGLLTALHVQGGQLTLTGSNTYTGGTTVDSGASLILTASSAYPSDTAIVNNGTVNNTANVVASTITGAGALSVGSGDVFQLASGSGTSSQGSVTVGSGGSLDVTSNEFLINYAGSPDPMATIYSYLVDGHTAKWAGGEIMSSTIGTLDATQSHALYELGFADAGTDSVPSGEVEILPTLAGDAKLQGNVVFGDFQIVAQYFGKDGPWADGNFQYSVDPNNPPYFYGPIGFGDFQELAQDFGQTSSGLTGGELASMQSFAAQFGDALAPNAGGGFSVVAVPEPATISLLAIGSVGLLGRRRRARNA
jgi:fibronectin-binding autotransporter adhesin